MKQTLDVWPCTTRSVFYTSTPSLCRQTLTWSTLNKTSMVKVSIRGTLTSLRGLWWHTNPSGEAEANNPCSPAVSTWEGPWGSGRSPWKRKLKPDFTWPHWLGCPTLPIIKYPSKKPPQKINCKWFQHLLKNAYRNRVKTGCMSPIQINTHVDRNTYM